jgi:hypothetical protein
MEPRLSLNGPNLPNARKDVGLPSVFAMAAPAVSPDAFRIPLTTVATGSSLERPLDSPVRRGLGVYFRFVTAQPLLRWVALSIVVAGVLVNALLLAVAV